ncbi:MAG: ERCC4 domain-containing protein [Verrucomicrobia bacterium]|nr:ERCC4 domain-containing protein [Verrucomicrobiota bacterium]
MKIIEDTRQKAGKHEIKHRCFAELGIDLVRCKLPYGDYAPVPPISIDTKENMDEIAGNICGSGHKRFIAECKAAHEAGCKLFILVENELGISDLSQVHTWENPRSAFSPNCVQGPRLQKAMETISARYGPTFLFCRPEEASEVIWELIKHYGEQTT